MSEFDITGRILLPYLKDLGIDPSEITFEDSFTIRLGRNKHATGRSDMLIKRHGRNLFVIEVKAESKQLTDADRDQGISYARLLDEIAPFTIVSNGALTKIYDSITKEELSGCISEKSAFWRNECSLSSDEDLKLRYEALKNFIAMSPENLRAFCELQVNDRMGMIIGDSDSRYAKFIKKLYVQRKDLGDVFETFVASGDSVFGLVGDAGVGKTNAMCSLALQKLEDFFVFFYNCAIITSPTECIAQDLNLAFSSRIEKDVALKKLDEMGRYAGKTVLIFIDAVDESTNSSIAQELSEMALIAKHVDKIKIIISCKTNIWDTVLKIKNKPTQLYQEADSFHRFNSSLKNPGYHLTDFTDEELAAILPLYQTEFGFKGDISDKLFPELRNGFFLKIFCEVYAEKQIPEKISDRELIAKYLKQTLQETEIGFEAGTRTLCAIANLLLDYTYSHTEVHNNDGIDVNHIIERLNYALDQKIPEDLFTRNILIRSNNEDSYNVSFYYSKIRDYAICFQIYKLDKKSNGDFYDVLTHFYQNHIGKSAIDFYIENASHSHKSTLVSFKKDKCLSYLSAYNSYLDENFSAFKEKFTPHTAGEIGIILPEDLIKGDGYALFPLSEKSIDNVVHLNLRNPFEAPYKNNPFLQTGAKSYRTSNISLLVEDNETIVTQSIFSQLREIIGKESIPTFSSDTLLFEQLAAIVYHYHEKLNYSYKIEDYYMPRYEQIYPIDLLDLKNRLNLFKIREHYRYKNIAREELAEIIERTISENLPIPKFTTKGHVPPFEGLSKIVDLLLKKGYRQIDAHYLPLADVSLKETKETYHHSRMQNSNRMRTVQFSESQAKEYTASFFRHLESCYKEFVEYNFPTLKDSFEFYNTMPHEYIVYLKDDDILQWGGFGYRHSDSGDFGIYFKGFQEEEKAFAEQGIICVKHFSMELILKVQDSYRYNVQIFEGISASKLEENCVIRSWLYKMLESDIDDILKKYER
ncbi:type I restriction enzyme HsdR N-terminal domain-containing protein [Flavobacterium panacagri]|uniref:type I restriction enzyme HsdR N-terminal domain-containing protein n=1 Tax=Flavobacterium panacagri TaxID=3034146 RepID=UPI0025A6525E|nr:type I restriction enzyme HsdR N-terminal domain-containing protein [Flavobacterium panacagri]